MCKIQYDLKVAQTWGSVAQIRNNKSVLIWNGSFCNLDYRHSCSSNCNKVKVYLKFD